MFDDMRGIREIIIDGIVTEILVVRVGFDKEEKVKVHQTQTCANGKANCFRFR
jgi:hypothetical protein